jgi:hypothetical protein
VELKWVDNCGAPASRSLVLNVSASDRFILHRRRFGFLGQAKKSTIPIISEPLLSNRTRPPVGMRGTWVIYPASRSLLTSRQRFDFISPSPEIQDPHRRRTANAKSDRLPVGKRRELGDPTPPKELLLRSLVFLMLPPMAGLYFTSGKVSSGECAGYLCRGIRFLASALQ